MVRYIVGLLVEIGMGRKPVDAVRRILAEQLHDWVRLKAPPQGLCLAYIAYPPDRLYPENHR
jgi:tRNA pseudouridine38-40 synthase